MRLAVIAAGIMFASASVASASPLNSASPVQFAQAQQNQKQAPQPEQKNVQDEKKKQNMAPKAAPQKATPPAAEKKKDETVTQKVKRVWRNWTTPSHSFCVRCPIPIPLTSKVCTAKGKTAEAARSTCVQQNPLCYVSAGKC
jgi:hypothetical protein